MTNAVHPATSSAFLSRLHDAELSPAEAIDFDRHRADCESCREAVAQFERSLAAFRTAPTTQVPSDLSARILRKIRAQSPSRRPFGVTFGIDIRWAGVFMAALLVAIIAPALLFKDGARHPAPAPDPISAYVVEAEPDSKAAAPPAPAPARPRSRDVAQAPAAKPEMKVPVDETRADSPAVLAQAPLPAESEEFAARRNAAAPLSAAPPAAAKREITVERSGGEAGAAEADELGAPKIQLTIRALDGSGQPPPVASAPVDSRLAVLRGREFVVIVETAGYVRSVAPAHPTASGSLQKKDAAADAGPEADPAAALLRELRFEPAGRPRRLLVRVE